MSAALGTFIALETFALTWALLACNQHKGYALVLALSGLVGMFWLLVLALAKGWDLPPAVARLVRGHVVLTEHKADDLDLAPERILSAARSGECWHVRGAVQPGACPCPAAEEERLKDARRQDARFLRGPARMGAAR